MDIGRGRLLWYLSRTETTGGKSTNLMSRDAGLTWPVNDADAPTPQNDIEILALQQYFFEDDLELITGKLFFANDYLQSKYYGDDKETFTSSMISSDPNGQFAQIYGLGIHTTYKKDNWFVSGGLSDNNATLQIDFPSFGDSNFIYALESGYQHTDDLGNETKVSVLYYYSDANQAFNQESAVVSAFTVEMGGDQTIALFGRYGVYNAAKPKDVLPLNYAGSHGGFIGVNFRAPFDLENLDLAVAVMSGAPANFVKRIYKASVGTEFYVKYQLTEWFTFSHNFQVLTSNKAGIDIVSGFRIRLYHDFF